jgi:hypothetical protein
MCCQLQLLQLGQITQFDGTLMLLVEGRAKRAGQFVRKQGWDGLELRCGYHGQPVVLLGRCGAVTVLQGMLDLHVVAAGFGALLDSAHFHSKQPQQCGLQDC